MNKAIKLLLSLSVVLSAAPAAVSAESAGLRVMIDSAPVRSAAPFYVEEGKAMIPLRAFAKSAGLQAEWDAAAKTLTIRGNRKDFVYTAKDPVVVIGGKPVLHNPAPLLKDGDLYVDSDALVRDFRVKLLWNEHTRAVVIETPLSLYVERIVRGSNLLEYKGDVKNGLPNGVGRWYKDGVLLYEGEFSDGKLNGAGRLYRNGKTAYEGAFADNLPNGTGTIYENGERYYAGDVKDGFPDGQGVLYINNRLSYSGQWKEGYMQGIGTVYDAQGRELYAGDFVTDERHGYGVEYIAGTKTYAGNWLQGKRSGYGKQFGEDGTIVYAGQWSNGERDGSGFVYRKDKITWYRTDGKTVLQETKKDVTYATPVVYRSGILLSQDKPLLYMGVEGSEAANIQQDNDEDHLNGAAEIRMALGHEVTEAGVLYESALVYLGNVRDGKRQGYGLEYSDGVLVYAGDFADDVRNGTGQSFMSGKLAYDGEWAGGKENGNGRLFSYDDAVLSGSGAVTITEGIFKDGSLVRESARYRYFGQLSGGTIEGSGVLVEQLPNGKSEKRYEGTFSKGRFDGNGKWYKDGKLVYEGTFSQGKRAGEGVSYHVYPSLIEYKGTFLGDLYEGKGKLYRYGNRLMYDGDFHQGQYHGTGRLYYDTVSAGTGSDGKAGLEYEGTFRNGLKHGYGKQYSTGGALVYEGEFVNGQPKGT